MLGCRGMLHCTAEMKRSEVKQLLGSASGRVEPLNVAIALPYVANELRLRRIGQIGNHPAERLCINSSGGQALAVLQDHLGRAEFWTAEFADRAFPDQRAPVDPGE